MKKILKFGLWGVIVAAVAAVFAYLLRSKIFQQWLGLNPAEHRVTVDEGIMVRMRDGVFLATDHYVPATADSVPTIMIRTPYGRTGRVGLIARFQATRFAERGYHVIVQDVRGRFDSEGEQFEPFTYEASDGYDTIQWLKTKPWFNGQIGLWGASYLGYVQWALMSEDVPEVQALVPITTQSNMGVASSPTMLFDNILRWMLILDAQMDDAISSFERMKRISDAGHQDKLIAEAVAHLPLKDADRVMLSKQLPFYQEWNEHPDGLDPYWEAVNHNDVVADVDVPVYMVAGWYDIFLKGQLEDYERLKAAGRNPYLLVSSWIHVDQEVLFGTIRHGLQWFDQQLKGIPSDLQPRPVRVGVMYGGQREQVMWRDYDVWPPESETRPFFLHTNERLVTQPVPLAEDASSGYVYDPAEPTPNLGGALLASSAGQVDNRPLEAREDVLVFTTEPLTQELEVIGYVTLKLYVRSSTPYTDFFGRVCDVQPDGRSINICDGLISLKAEDWQTAADGVLCVEIELAATAYRFLAGHRIRLQVSSGAHPRFNRNLGTDELAVAAEKMTTAAQTIFHDQARPSQLLLPVTDE